MTDELLGAEELRLETEALRLTRGRFTPEDEVAEREILPEEERLTPGCEAHCEWLVAPQTG